MFILKSLKPIYSDSVVYNEFLRKEYEIGCKFSHPNICKTISFEHLPELGKAILMEYIPGLSLREYINRNLLNSSNSKKIIDSLLNVFNYIHKSGIIHKDIKPENILICSDNQEVKIIDFGLSHSSSYRYDSGAAGTFLYIAPEQIKGELVDFRADIYSLGVLINEILALPNIKLPSIYTKIAHKSIKLIPDCRYNTIDEIYEHIRKNASRRKRFKVLSVVASLIFGLLIAIYSLSFGRQANLDHESVSISNEILDISDIHFKCYKIIDSLLNSNSIKSSDLSPVNIDTALLFSKLKYAIDAEYGSNLNSIEYKQSIKWAREELNRLVSQ